ncbi:DUF6884 domain-containing protein [Enterovibrio norvegicus]|uniref:DUF6884 domain-containing protein n=1 Tax=Enterovibrio norvegicus TaxID=188144 RepID=UPI00352E4648
MADTQSFDVIYSNEKSQKPILILPCSASKAKVSAAPAYKLYTGALMAIMNKWSWVEITTAFNVFFLSAKYGLVKHNEELNNYDQKLDESCLRDFENDEALKRSANELLSTTSRHANTYIMLPKMYAKGLEALCCEELKYRVHKRTFNPGSGIGSQRGQINELLSDYLGSPVTKSRITE